MLHEIRPAAQRARSVRRILGKAMRAAISDRGNGLAGFALVTWDGRGEATSAYLTEYGIIGESLMPAFVRDVLGRHVTIAVNGRSESRQVTDD